MIKSRASDERLRTETHEISGRVHYLKAGSISVRLSAVKIVARMHFRGITAACVSITGEIIVALPSIRRRGARKLRQTLLPMARRAFAPNVSSL